MQIVVSNISVEVIKKNIKNMHLSVLPPDGRVRVSAPVRLTDEAITKDIDFFAQNAFPLHPFIRYFTYLRSRSS